ncbi:MAG: DNA recombination protein RmuC [Balneolaceae bacterium]
MDLTLIVLTLIAILAGAALGYFIGKSGLSRLEERNQSLGLQMEESVRKTEEERRRADEAERELAGLKADYRNLNEKLQVQKEEFQKLQETFREQFENLANRILDEKSKKFTEQNREKMDQLLKPLGEKIEQFRKQVAETYEKETRDRVSLKEQIRQMSELNQKMNEETKNLTKALKGSSKQQGNWGEVILQRILEKSGLTRGREYELQESRKSEDGRSLQPDVVVYLPEEKRLVIDSKVSLTAYERYSSAEDDELQETAVRQHIQSVRAHVKGLSGKEYQKLYGGNSPDFVLLFIPIESAFGLALQFDPDLYYEAFEMNIVIVSPSTLLATLATIDSIWKQEYQNKNALEIAARGGALYDKFIGFIESMKDIGQRIDQTQKSYDQAMSRLSTGHGNVVRQVEMLKELGAKASKKLPEDLQESREHPKKLTTEKDSSNGGESS